MDTNEGAQSKQREVPECNKKLPDSFFIGVQREVREKPDDDGKVMLQDLLDTANANSIEQMLEYLFDDFMRLLGPDCLLRLQEKCQDLRFLCVLIRKLQTICQGDSVDATLASLQCSAQQWTALAAIIAALEDQDSHLVVGTLEKQLPQLQLMASDLGERWISWLRILCLRLFKEDRVQVLRKTLEYFLTHLSVEQICRLSLLQEFVVATNRSQLFDPEDDNCLTEEHLKKFVSVGNMESLLTTLVTVSWENVPLFLWIWTFKSEQVKNVPKGLVFKLCQFVRHISNRDLKWAAQRHVIVLFKDTIDGCSLGDYVLCMKSLFNKGDLYCDHRRLLEKIDNCTDFEEHIECFNQRTFEIFFSDVYCFNNLQVKLVETLILKMESLPKHKHEFLRLALYPKCSEVLMDFYHKFYNVDTSLLQKGASLEKMQEHLLDRLDCETDEEIFFLKSRCVDLFTLSLETWHQLEELNLDVLELMEQGTDDTMIALAHLLGGHEKRIRDEKILPAMIAHGRSNFVIEHVLAYAYKFLTEKKFNRCITNMLLQKKMFWLPDGKLSISMYIKLLIRGEPTKRLERIEAACAYKVLGIVEINAQIRYKAITKLNDYKNIEMKSNIFKELLRINESLSIEHPHHPENSEVHRLKMRIAIVLIQIRDNCDDPKFLETLLLPSDHLGINLMHEFLIGNCVKSIEWVLKALPSLQPRQQESYLSIAYIFITKNLVKLNEDNKLSEIFTSLLPLTMGSSNETRTLAQLILHKLALQCEKNSIHIPVAEILKTSVETALGKQLYELQSDPRLMLAEIPEYFPYKENISYYILYMTNAPFDEILLNLPKILRNKFKKSREAFRAKKVLSNNLYTECSFDENSELVAVLLDKKPSYAK